MAAGQTQQRPIAANRDQAPIPGQAVTRLLENAARDIGRLRRRHPNEYLLDRLADTLETLDAIEQPTAAELYQGNLWTSGDEDAALIYALQDTDQRAHTFRHLLGGRT